MEDEKKKVGLLLRGSTVKRLKVHLAKKDDGRCQSDFVEQAVLALLKKEKAE